MRLTCKIRVATVVVLAALVAGCPTTPRERGPSALPEAVPSTPSIPPSAGKLYGIVTEESLLTILVYRGGPLARTGHNHVIASRSITGTVQVTDGVVGSSFELVMPVDTLTVDEPELRAPEGEEFPPEVPESAREGTRKNMLGPQVLDAARFPVITLRGRVLNAAGEKLETQAQVQVRDQVRSLSVPVTYQLESDRLTVSGDLAVRQTDLGLTPFSVLMGALQVQDELKVRFRFVARPAQP